MDKIQPEIKLRVLEFIESQNIKKEDFFQKTGISASNFKGVGRKSELGGDKVAKILREYPWLNNNWLVLGKGEMIDQELQRWYTEMAELKRAQKLQQEQLLQLLRQMNLNPAQSATKKDSR